jgi:hypothetical protein
MVRMLRPSENSFVLQLSSIRTSARHPFRVDVASVVRRNQREQLGIHRHFVRESPLP